MNVYIQIIIYTPDRLQIVTEYCLTDCVFGTALSLLTTYFVLEYPYWLILCTG